MNSATIGPRIYDDDELQAWRKWSAVLCRWMDGDPAPMAAWLLNPEVELPEDAREFLADLVQGKVKRQRGRRPRRSAQADRAIACLYFQEYETQAIRPRITNPQDKAYATTAERLNASVDTVRGIVERLAKSGITLEAWQKWGRPDWAT